MVLQGDSDLEGFKIHYYTTSKFKTSGATSLHIIKNRFIYFLKNVVTMATLLLGLGMQ